MTVVVKIGGARAVDPAGAIADVASLVDSGEDVVVTHGGSTAVDELLDRLGMEPEYVETPCGVAANRTSTESSSSGLEKRSSRSRRFGWT